MGSILTRPAQTSHVPPTLTGTQPATVVTQMDSIPVTEATHVKWMVQVQEMGSPSSKHAVEVHALSDGTFVNYTEYGILSLGSPIVGLVFNVEHNGPNLRITVNSTNGVDYVIKRIAYSAF